MKESLLTTFQLSCIFVGREGSSKINLSLKSNFQIKFISSKSLIKIVVWYRLEDHINAYYKLLGRLEIPIFLVDFTQILLFPLLMLPSMILQHHSCCSSTKCCCALKYKILSAALWENRSWCCQNWRLLWKHIVSYCCCGWEYN